MKKLFVTALIPMASMAHPGGVSADGSHTCWSQCEKYGLKYGQVHYPHESMRAVTYRPRSFTGIVEHVRDGDTLIVDGVAIRLHGVSAPEKNEPLGAQSKFWMQEHVLGEWVSCRLTGDRTFDRAVGRCFKDGVDVAIPLIEAGLARDCPRYSNGRYGKHEASTASEIKLPGYCK